MRAFLSFKRIVPILILSIVCASFATAAAPAARAEGFTATVFKSRFEELPSGPLSATPVAVEVGRVLSLATPADAASFTGLSGQALVVRDSGSAELRFSSYPDPLPQALNSERYELVVRANLAAAQSALRGGVLYLGTVDGARFEVLRFGADGKLARGDSSLNLAYTSGGKVELEARFDLKDGVVILSLETAAGTLVLDTMRLPGSFNPDTVGRLIFSAGGAAGSFGLDDVEVRVEKDEKRGDPPAQIVITPPPAATIEVVGDVTFIVFSLIIDNSGGKAKEVFLTLECDDDLIDLLDLTWVAGIGYVKERSKGTIVIGIGQNNVAKKEKFELKFKFKLKIKRDGEIKINVKYSLKYRDSGGVKVIAPVVIIIVVPSPTPAATPTAPPTVTGTPPTATPTVTGTPPTATPTATPTVTGTPPTATPTLTPTLTPTASGG